MNIHAVLPRFQQKRKGDHRTVVSRRREVQLFSEAEKVNMLAPLENHGIRNKKSAIQFFDTLGNP